MPKAQKIILFDGVCNLCNGWVQFVINHDIRKIFRFGSLQSEGGRVLLKKHGLPLNDYDSFVYVKDNQVYLKSTAALHVLKDLGGFYKFFYIFIVIPRPVRDFAYSLIAKNRYFLFGKRESCMLPSPELRNRFLG